MLTHALFVPPLEGIERWYSVGQGWIEERMKSKSFLLVSLQSRSGAQPCLARIDLDPLLTCTTVAVIHSRVERLLIVYTRKLNSYNPRKSEKRRRHSGA